MVRIVDFLDVGLGHSSYLVDLGDGSAMMVDPPRFPDAHIDLAEREGLRIVWTTDTHSHADYVTGSPGIADRNGAAFIAPAASRLATPHEAAVDAKQISLADSCVLTPIATPGHTPDHHSYLLECRGEQVALFTGGSLMVGTVGRTDLAGPGLAESLAGEMFRSLRRFDDLPDDLAVYPTHGAGSFCGAPGSDERTTTLGAERQHNPLFAISNEDEFVESLMSGFGTFPSYFARMPELNRLGPRHYDQVPELKALSAHQVAHHRARGRLIVDARPMAEFAAGHIAGSMSNTLRPAFASWIGWLTQPDEPIVFVLDEDQDRADLVRQCLNVGVENLAGELEGGIDPWSDGDHTIAKTSVVNCHQLGETVLDVRQRNEYAAGHIPGAVNVELAAITDGPTPEGQVTVMCGHGERAMTAASLLAMRGAPVSVFDGGPDTWAADTGLELDVPL